MSVNTPFHTLLEVFLFTEQSETNLHHSYAERYLLRFTHALSNLSLENDHKQTTAPSDRQTQTDRQYGTDLTAAADKVDQGEEKLVQKPKKKILFLKKS